MNKVINVTIGNSQFDVEEIVYHKLEKYLTEVGKLFKDNPEKKEILNDLEDRIAEKFSQNEGKAVTEKQLESVIEALGTPHEIAEAEKENQSTTNDHHNTDKTPKKLYRKKDDVMIAGVCSGIAEYFNIDPSIVRIITVVAGIVLFPIVPIAYIVLAIILPKH